MDMADWYGVVLRRLLRSADRFSDRAILCGSLDLKTAFSRSSALLRLFTSADQRRPFAPPVLRAAVLRAVVLRRAELRAVLRAAVFRAELRPALFPRAWAMCL